MLLLHGCLENACQAFKILLAGMAHFVTISFVFQRRIGEPLRAYMDLEAGRKRSGHEDIYISYHAEDDVQSTYAGALFHNGRNYHISNTKNNVSNILNDRQRKRGS